MVKRIKKVQSEKQTTKPKTQTVKTENKSSQEIKIPAFIKKYPFLTFSILLIITLLIVFKDYIFMSKLFLFKDIGSDTLNTFYPTYVLARDAIKEGISYSFRNGMGGATGIGSSSFDFNIVNFLINPFANILFLWEGKNIAWGLGIIEVLKIFTAGIIFFAYLRTMKLKQLTATVGAFLFAFSGFMIGGSCWYQHTYLLLYAALLLLGFEQALMKSRNWVLLIVVLATFSAINLFYVYVFGTFIAVYSLLRVIIEKDKFKDILIFYAKIITIVVLVILVNLSLLIVQIESILNSPRVSGNLSKSEQMQSISIFAGGGFLHNVTAILRFFSNDILGSGRVQEQFINGQRLLISDYKGYFNYYEAPMFYIGSFSLLLFPQFLVLKRKKESILYGIFFLFWLIPVVFPYFRRAYFLFFGDYYRIFSFFLPFTILLPALHVFDKLLKENKINLYLLWASSVFLLLLLFYPYFSEEYITKFGWQQSPIVNSIRLIVVMCILLYTIALSMQIKFPQKKNYSLAVLMIFIIFEPVYMANKTINDRDMVSKKEFLSKDAYNDYTIEAVKYLKSTDSGFFRTEKDYSSSNAVHGSINDAKIQGYFGTSSYSSNQNIHYINFLQTSGVIPPGDETAARWAPGVHSRALLAVMVNVKYMLSKTAQPYFTAFGYKAIKKFGDVTVYKNDFSLPLGYSYDKKIKQSDFEQLSVLQKDICFMRAAVLPDTLFDKYTELEKYEAPQDSIYSKEMLKADITKLSEESMQTLSFKEDKITGKINLSKPRMVFFSFLYDTNWKIYANEKLQKNILTNIGFTGVLLPAGKYELELRYEPNFKVNNWQIFRNIVLLVVFLGGIIWEIRRMRLARNKK